MKNRFDILIIDDEQVVIDSIRKIAELENYTTDFTLCAKEALKKLSENEYELIICDIMLPQMDGFQFLQEVDKRNILTPVIITTGFSTIENAVKSLYLGAIDFIPKPFSIDEMTSLLHRGMKFKKIKFDKEKNLADGLVVSCPPKFFRLGISCWANIDLDGSVCIGATNFFIKTIDQVDKIELLSIGDIITQALTCAKFFSGEFVHNLYSALSGRIIEVNEKLLHEPELIEKDPYFDGWMYRIIPQELEYEKQKLIPCGSDR